jgi:hypothetical protein
MRGCRETGSEMNLSQLKRSRRIPQRGDVFALAPAGHGFLFGRVISTDANPLGVGDANLVYIYATRSPTKNAVPTLSLWNLLVPPLMTNRRPWTMGYIEFVANRPLAPGDQLPRHCFRDSRGWYFDEHGARLAEPAEPVGTWGLHSFKTIDDEVSRALGIPLSSLD